MKKFIPFTTILVFLIFTQSIIAQEIITPPKENYHEADSGKVLTLIEVTPSFPGGDKARMTFLSNNIIYPEISKERNEQGIVFISFVVEKDGRLTHIHVIRGVSTEIDKEVVRVIKKMPKWKPGKIKNEVVRSKFNMPVKFTLQGGNTPPKDSLFEGVATEDVMPVEENLGDKEDDEIFVFVKENASYPGGPEARMKYIRENIKYPELAKEEGIQGTVYLNFVVEKDGSITNVKVLRGIGGGCDEESIRVVKNMPKWKPAMQRGKPVRVYFNIPIKFTLYGGGDQEKKLSKRELRKLKRKNRKE